MVTMLSFSTMWAQQDRFRNLASFRQQVAAFGFTGIEVSHSTNQAGLATLMGEGEISLTSLHAPTPSRKLADGRPNGDANLASTDEAERRLALVETKRTLDYAARAGLPFVVIHLGGVGNKMNQSERKLRRLFQEGSANSEAAQALRHDLKDWRAAGADAHIEAARKSLKELVEHASPHRIALGLESRLHYHEIPHPGEAVYLVSDFGNDVAGYWHDVGHCEVQARLGMIDRSAWFPLLTPFTIGQPPA